MSRRVHTVHGIVNGDPIESVVVTETAGNVRSYLVHGNRHLTIDAARALVKALQSALVEAAIAPSVAAVTGGGE